MSLTRTLFALLVIQMFALAALAQNAAAEFGRSSGGTIGVTTKGPSRISGTLAFTHSTGAFSGARYEASLGGTIVPDRLWFFAAASVLPRAQFSTSDMTAIDAKANAQPVDWADVTASFNRLAQPIFLTTTPQVYSRSLPSSFLSLHSTSMLSDRMMLNFSFSRSTPRPVFGSAPIDLASR